MQTYMLSVIEPSGDEVPPPEVLEPIMRDVERVHRELEEAGAWVFGGGLHPKSAATTIRHDGQELVVTDGPFLETKEQIGGFSIIKVADLDAALEWAKKVAKATTLPIEVRPVQH